METHGPACECMLVRSRKAITRVQPERRPRQQDHVTINKLDYATLEIFAVPAASRLRLGSEAPEGGTTPEGSFQEPRRLRKGGSEGASWKTHDSEDVSRNAQHLKSDLECSEGRQFGLID